MRVHYLQHVPFEGLGSIEPWLESRGHSISRTCMFSGEALPDIHDLDWLIVMGGPMGANDDATLPWLPAEKRFIRAAIDSGKRVLGICLGAQLIAAVLGARVFKNRHPEIGWFEIERTTEASGHAIGQHLPERAEVFHWHGDTFDLPSGALRLAGSEACANQAFAYGANVLALQFHLETLPESVAQMVEHCSDELTPGPYTQSAEQMLERPDRFEQINQWMGRLLEAMSS